MLYNVRKYQCEGKLHMFKFDKFTAPYYISNAVFYIFTLAVLAFIYYYIFWPPISELSTEDFFENFGLRELGGTLFFSVIIIVPFLVLYGAVYHLYKLATVKKQKPAEDN